MKKYFIFSIETSCDETSVAVVECRQMGKKNIPALKIRSHVVHSQIEQHQKTFGVVPEVAAREHTKKIIPVLKKTVEHFEEQLGEKDCTQKLIGAIAVTAGPGLITSLHVGVETAKALSIGWKKPLIVVNHLEGHIFSAFLEHAKDGLNIEFSALALIVSGGHTQFILMREREHRKLIGETLDDAVGEAFDKVAKLLQLGYPGGPIISSLAENGNPETFPFPRPMERSNNLNMSFSGLKTAVLYTVEKLKIQNVRKPTFERNRTIGDICASFEKAVIDVLAQKSLKAVKKYAIKTFILGGGVAANKRLRKSLYNTLKSAYPKLNFFVPRIDLATDNAAMIGAAASLKFLKKDFTPIKDVFARPNWNL